MSRILVASTPLLGHVTPMLQIAAALQGHGREVSFLTSDSFRESVERQGVHFHGLSGHANYNWLDLRPDYQTKAKSLGKRIRQSDALAAIVAEAEGL